MKRYHPSYLFFIILSLFFTKTGISQLEITPYYRIDKYSEFKTAYLGRASVDNITLRGSSFGINIGYKFPIADDIYITPSVGYFEQDFSSIKNNNSQFGKSESRHIDFISQLFILFSTDKYTYRSINLNIGAEKVFPIGNKGTFSTGINISNYISFGQRYHLTHNPGGSEDYKRKDIKYSGSTIAFLLGVNKKWGKNALGPVLIIPIFNIERKDVILGESPGLRSNLMIGIGLGISYTHDLF